MLRSRICLGFGSEKCILWGAVLFQDTSFSTVIILIHTISNIILKTVERKRMVAIILM